MAANDLIPNFIKTKKEFLKFIHKLPLAVIFGEPNNSKIMTDNKLHYVCWYMTYYCNLDCEYCYAFKKNRTFDFDKYLTVGNELINQGIKKVNLTGGEPFASKSLLKVVNEFYKKLDISITTNGTLGSINHLNFLKGKIERLTISIDSINNDLGKILRSKKCDTNKILEFTKSAILLDFEVKVNTVISKYNFEHLTEIGNWLSQFENQVAWKLFQVTENPNITNLINDFLISDLEFDNKVNQLSSKFPKLQIKKATSFDLNHNYVILTPEGNVQIPYLNSYKSIGNILERNINSILEESDFSFIDNKLEFNKPTIRIN